MCNLLARCPKRLEIRGSQCASLIYVVSRLSWGTGDVAINVYSLKKRCHFGDLRFESPMCSLLARCPKRLEIRDSRFESPMCNLLARYPKRLEIGDSRFESPMCNLLAQSKGQCSISSDLLGHRSNQHLQECA